MSVVRLEYRNVTMRFADSNGAGALTAVTAGAGEIAMGAADVVQPAMPLQFVH